MPSIDEYLNAWIAEVTELRFSIALPAIDASPHEMLALLRDVRVRMDRVEELMLQALRVKAKTHRAKLAADAVSEEAWDRASESLRGKDATKGGDFVGPRERYASANLAVIQERRDAKRASEMFAFAEECYDYIRTAHRGLDGLRQDCLTLLRSAQYESSWERTT